MLLSHKTLISFIVSLAMFMETVDSTIINTAIPSMAISLHVAPLDLKIALISYLLSLAIFIPISGWFADKWGIKQVFVSAMVLFVLSSTACGFAPGLLELVLARIVQGFAGALMVPVGRLILLRTFARHEFMAAMNHVVMVMALGLMLGPVLGGLITHYWSWQWIFWVNIPFGLLAIFLSSRFLLKEVPRPVPRLDMRGFLLFGTALAALSFGLSALSETFIAFWLALTLILVAFVLLILYKIHSRHITNPVVNIQLFRHRTFAISVSANLIARLGFGGIPFLLPLMFQLSLGYSAECSGLLLAPIALGVVVAKYFSIRLLRLLNYKKCLMINTLLVCIMQWTFSRIDHASSVTVIASLTFIFGTLMSLQYTSMNSLAYTAIPPEEMSAASSIMSTVQQLAQSFGVAICALLLHYLTKGSATSIGLVTFQHTFLALSLITLCSSAIFLRLKANDGIQMLRPM